MPQWQIAYKMGVSESWLSRLLRTDRDVNPSDPRIKRLSNLLRIPIAAMFDPDAARKLENPTFLVRLRTWISVCDDCRKLRNIRQIIEDMVPDMSGPIKECDKPLSDLLDCIAVREQELSDV